MVLLAVAGLTVMAFRPTREVVWQDLLPGGPPRLVAGGSVELPIETPYANLYGIDVRWQGEIPAGSVHVDLRRGMETPLSAQGTLDPSGEPLRLRFEPFGNSDGLRLVLDGRDLPPGSELFIMGDAGGNAPLTFYHRLNGLDLARAYLIAATRGKPLWWNSPAALLVLLVVTAVVLAWFTIETISGSGNL